MITVRCLYSNGDVITTPINDNLEGARKYFLDHWFNLGIVEDNMQKCIKVEELKEVVNAI